MTDLREQARSYSGSVSAKIFVHNRDPVGAGLPAMADCQSTMMLNPAALLLLLIFLPYIEMPSAGSAQWAPAVRAEP
jgi:hypothetical protein